MAYIYLPRAETMIFAGERNLSFPRETITAKGLVDSR
jgi:hypothetical protein